jgi:hypothetical protein
VHDVVHLGDLELPDGGLMVCDPFLALAPSAVSELGPSLPPDRYRVEAVLVADPAAAGGRRVGSLTVRFLDVEVTRFEDAFAVPVDSGAIALAPTAVGERLKRGDEDDLAALDADLAEHAEDTWERSDLLGALTVTAGFGDGVLDAYWGFAGDDERAACLTIDTLPDWQLATRSRGVLRRRADPASGSPGRGLQRGLLFAAALGGDWDPRNVVSLPPRANRTQARVERTLVRALLADREVEVEMTPEYAGDSPVPARIRFAGTLGEEPFDQAVDVEP